MQKLFQERKDYTIAGTNVSLDLLTRSGDKTPIVFLHGFGSTKEDYADIMFWPAFDGHSVLAYDAPGFGQSQISDHDNLSIPFLVETAKTVLEDSGIDRFHLIGHSMGGLTALVLAHELQDRVMSFTDIEGNVAPEDCFLSRQIITHFHEDADAFMGSFQTRARHQEFFSHHLYATSLTQKVQNASIRPVFESMVELSDNMPLIDWITGLPGSAAFMHGDQNATLSYLSELAARGVDVVSIPHCGHFPMYANPPAMWAGIAANVAKGEGT